MIFPHWTTDAKRLGAFVFSFCLITPAVFAQEAAPASVSMMASSSSASELPEAPSPHVPERKAAATAADGAPEASITAKYIPAGWHAQPLTAGEKVTLGVRDLYTPESLIGYVIPAGYSHLTNGQPNFGTNSGAFAQRVGATFARDVSQAVFSDVLLAPAFHEDPRFYVMGSSHSVAHRTLYAISRPFLTRNDEGRTTINGSLLVGYAGAAALTGAYYPASNRNLHDIASTYGGSIGGAALGFVFQEFTHDLLAQMHLHHK